MKIAICISGHTRNFEYYSKFLFDKVISNNNIEFDIFISTWSTIDYNTDEKLNIDKLIDIYNPIRIIVEKNNPNLFNGYDYLTRGNKASLVFSQLYKISQVAKMMKEHSEVNGFEYDLIFKTRFDVEVLPLCETWGENIPNEIEPKINFDYFEKNFFYVEEDHGGYYNWFHDKCFISSQKNFLSFSSIFDHLGTLMSNYQELLLLQHFLVAINYSQLM